MNTIFLIFFLLKLRKLGRSKKKKRHASIHSSYHQLLERNNLKATEISYNSNYFCPFFFFLNFRLVHVSRFVKRNYRSSSHRKSLFDPDDSIRFVERTARRDLSIFVARTKRKWRQAVLIIVQPVPSEPVQRVENRVQVIRRNFLRS